MFMSRIHALLIVVVLFACAPVASAKSHAEMEAGPAKPPVPAIDSLQLEPASVTLANVCDGRRVLVWGVAADGRKFDLSDEATFKCDSTNLVLDKENYVYPRPDATGEGIVTVSAGGKQATLAVKLAGSDDPKVRFVRDVQPILSQVGCNAGTCHGAAKGKNGFKLSLRGYDPIYDYAALVQELQGRA